MGYGALLLNAMSEHWMTTAELQIACGSANLAVLGRCLSPHEILDTFFRFNFSTAVLILDA